MRIEDKIRLGYDKLVDPKKKQSTAETKSSTAAKEDKVSISSQGKDVANLASTVKSAPEIRTEKVDQIKTELNEGSYNVDGKQVAEKIVNTAIDDLF